MNLSDLMDYGLHQEGLWGFNIERKKPYISTICSATNPSNNQLEGLVALQKKDT